jgi:hypothetical protein
LVRACKAGPSGFSRSQCLCLEKALTKVLSPEEIKAETLYFEGKIREWQYRVDAMGGLRAQDFKARIAKATAGSPCTK